MLATELNSYSALPTLRYNSPSFPSLFVPREGQIASDTRKWADNVDLRYEAKFRGGHI